MEGNNLRSAAAVDDLSSVDSSDSLLSGEAMEGNNLRLAEASDDLSSVISSVGSSDSLLSGEAMEGNNLRLAASSDDLSSVGSSDDWHKQIRPGARQGIINCIVNHIMDTLKGHLPISVPEALNELKKIVVRFEEKIYTAATTQSDYLRKISLKMLSMENKNSGANAINPSLSNPTIGNQSPSDSATMLKIIKEMLPPDVRVARDTQDLLVECCVGNNSSIFYLPRPTKYVTERIREQLHLSMFSRL